MVPLMTHAAIRANILLVNVKNRRERFLCRSGSLSTTLLYKANLGRKAKEKKTNIKQ